MGEVWLVHDSELDEELVAKIVPRDADDDRLALLRRECRHTRRLEHANIVRVYDFHRCDEVDCITMARVDGEPISRLRGGRPAEILEAAIAIADALDYAHSRGIVHRDLKAANIVCEADGKPRLLDFGIAGLLDEPDDLRRGGTRSNASPQQLAGQPPCPADDIYALGALLYELLSGHDVPPGPHSPPHRLVSNHPIPNRLITLVESMLRESPTDRPPDAASIRRALQEIRDDLGE